MKYDLPPLGRNTRFTLWKVKMWAVLMHLEVDDALDKFSNKDSNSWTEEKGKDHKTLTQIQLHLSNNILQDVFDTTRSYSDRSVLIMSTNSSCGCLTLFFLLLRFFFFLVTVVSSGRYNVYGCPGDCRMWFLKENFSFLPLIVKQILVLSM